MQFMGGKERIATPLVRELAALAARRGCARYLEPFMGGASIASRMAPLFPGAATLADRDADLAAMWAAARDGWDPPRGVTREQYAAAKDLPAGDPMRAFVAYGCSFGGKRWGGYASNARGDDFAGAARRGVIRKARGLAGANIVCADYANHAPAPGTLVYCDPPYAGTTGYGEAWDPEAFWRTMNAWASRGATVAVSEYTAPNEGWVSVWTQERRMALDATSNTRTATEHLFVRALP